MFEMFKTMFETAEKIGTITAASFHVENNILGTRAEVSGVASDGTKFHMEAWRDEEPANE